MFSIDYLRTTLTLMVLAHHSSLAYTTFAHFDKQHIFQSTAPVVDVTRWPFFDYAENFNDRPEITRFDVTGWWSEEDSNLRCREKSFRRKIRASAGIFRVEIGTAGEASVSDRRL